MVVSTNVAYVTKGEVAITTNESYSMRQDVLVIDVNESYGVSSRNRIEEIISTEEEQASLNGCPLYEEITT